MSTTMTTDIVNEAIEPSRSHVVVRDLVVIFFYSLVMLVSLFGNLVVIKVILFRQAMRKRITNVFIANLTISDLIVTVFTIPMNIGKYRTSCCCSGALHNQTGPRERGHICIEGGHSQFSEMVTISEKHSGLSICFSLEPKNLLI